MTNTNVIIGLTGRFGSGCTTTSLFLTQEEEFKYLSLSRVLKEKAKKEIKDLDKIEEFKKRKILQDLGDELRKKNPAALALSIIKQIKQEKPKDVVVDSIRNPAEVDAFRNNFKGFTLIDVDAETEIRWQRLKKIYNNKREMFDIDEKRDEGVNQPDYGQHVKECIEIADIQISNNKDFFKKGTKKDEEAIDEFGQKIADYRSLIHNPLSRKPTFDEIYMHHSFSVAIRSYCLKKQVGAVIVKERQLQSDKTNKKEMEVKESYLIATGCNNVPIGEEECKEFCYKDSVKDKYLADNKFCKKCGKKLEKSEFICQGCEFDNSKLPGKLLDVCRSVHAEEAAILQAAKLGSTSLENTKLYTTTFPCMLCCKKIINTGIKSVIYSEPYPMEESLAIEMFRKCYVNVKKFDGVNSIAFNKFFKIIANRNIGFYLIKSF